MEISGKKTKRAVRDFFQETRKKSLSLFSDISQIINITPFPIINIAIFFIFGLFTLQYLFAQIFHSVFVSSHILSWDSYVYICGVNLFLGGEDPYNYITLRDCLPANWNFYFNMPYTLLFLYLPLAKLTNFQWLLLINGVNFFLLLISFREIIKNLSSIGEYWAPLLLYFFFISNTFDGAITVALYTGNLGVTVALVGLLLLIKYIKDDTKHFLWFIVLASILKPIYICFIAGILLKEETLKNSIRQIALVCSTVIGIYFITFLLNPTLFHGFLANTAYLANSIDIGFGFTSLVREGYDRLGIDYSSISMLTAIGIILCILHLVFVHFLVNIKDYNFEEKLMLIAFATLLFFPRIKVYDTLYAIPLISYLPFYLYNTYKNYNIEHPNLKSYIYRRLHLVAILLILYPLFIYNRWEPYHFTFILLASLYMLIGTVQYKKSLRN